MVSVMSPIRTLVGSESLANEALECSKMGATALSDFQRSTVERYYGPNVSKLSDTLVKALFNSLLKSNNDGVVVEVDGGCNSKSETLREIYDRLQPFKRLPPRVYPLEPEPFLRLEEGDYKVHFDTPNKLLVGFFRYFRFAAIYPLLYYAARNQEKSFFLYCMRLAEFKSFRMRFWERPLWRLLRSHDLSSFVTWKNFSGCDKTAALEYLAQSPFEDFSKVYPPVLEVQGPEAIAEYREQKEAFRARISAFAARAIHIEQIVHNFRTAQYTRAMAGIWALTQERYGNLKLATMVYDGWADLMSARKWALEEWAARRFESLEEEELEMYTASEGTHDDDFPHDDGEVVLGAYGFEIQHVTAASFTKSLLWKKFISMIVALNVPMVLGTMPSFLKLLVSLVSEHVFKIDSWGSVLGAIGAFVITFSERFKAFLETYDFREFLKDGGFDTYIERGYTLLKESSLSGDTIYSQKEAFENFLKEGDRYRREDSSRATKKFTLSHERIYSAVATAINKLDTIINSASRREKEPFSFILLGPPGTGKTTAVSDFSEWAIQRDSNRAVHPGTGLKMTSPADLYTVPNDKHWNGCHAPYTVLFNDIPGSGYTKVNDLPNYASLMQVAVDVAPFFTPQADLADKARNVIDPKVVAVTSNHMRWRFDEMSSSNSRLIRRYKHIYYYSYPTSCYAQGSDVTLADEGVLKDPRQVYHPSLRDEMRVWKCIMREDSGMITFSRAEFVGYGYDTLMLSLKKDAMKYERGLHTLAASVGPECCSQGTAIAAHEPGTACLPGCSLQTTCCHGVEGPCEVCVADGTAPGETVLASWGGVTYTTSRPLRQASRSRFPVLEIQGPISSKPVSRAEGEALEIYPDWFATKSRVWADLCLKYRETRDERYVHAMNIAEMEWLAICREFGGPYESHYLTRVQVMISDFVQMSLFGIVAEIQGGCITKAKAVKDSVVDRVAEEVVSRRFTRLKSKFSSLIGLFREYASEIGLIVAIGTGLLLGSKTVRASAVLGNVKNPVSHALEPHFLERYGVKEAPTRELANPPRYPVNERLQVFASPSSKTTAYADLKRLVESNTLHFTDGCRKGVGLLVDSQTLLLNHHVYEAFQGTVVEVGDRLKCDLKTTFTIEGAWRVPGEDICFMTVPTYPAADLTKHFGDSYGSRCSGSINGVDSAVEKMYVDFGGNLGFSDKLVFTYAWCGEKGCCGTPLILNVDGKGLIGGIHVARLASGRGAGVIVYRKWIVEAKKELRNTGGSLVLFPIVDQTQGSMEPLASVSKLRQASGVSMAVFGTFERGMRPSRSRLRKTVLYEVADREMAEKKVIPALHQEGTLKDGTWLAPYVHKFKGMAVRPRLCSLSELKLASKDYLEGFPPGVAQPITLHQAIAGVDGDCLIKAMNLKTSSGIFQRFFSNKRELLDSEEIMKELKDHLCTYVEVLESSAVAEHQKWALKDEPVTVAKDGIKKYRYFMVSDLLNLLAMRMFVAPIVAHLYQHKEWSEAFGAFNPASPEFGAVVSRMRNFEHLILADMKHMDSSHRAMMADTVADVFKQMGAKLGYNPEACNVVYNLIRSVVFSQVELNGDLAFFSEGMGSGVYVTFVFNCLTLSMLYRVAWFRLTSGHFRESNCLIAGGDDSALSTSCSAFDSIHVASVFLDYGYELSPPTDKSGALQAFYSWDDFVFLKRSPRTIEFMGKEVVVGALDKDSIWKAIAFEMPSPEISSADRLAQVLDAGQREMALHGKDAFADFQSKVPDGFYRKREWEEVIALYIVSRFYDDIVDAPPSEGGEVMLVLATKASWQSAVRSRD